MMQFTLSSLLISFVVVSAALAAFGPIYGAIVAAILISAVAIVRSSTRPLGAGTAVGCWWTIVLLAIMSFWATPVHGPSYYMHCRNNLKQISLALQSYQQLVGHYPPAYVKGPDGKPWHSWRVLLLPYLEQRSLYQQYRFDEPWNGPNNSKLASTIPDVYGCGVNRKGQGNTNYLAVVGPQAAWLGADARKADDFSQPGATIQLVEAADSRISWMEPRDISIEDALKAKDSQGLPLILGSRHHRSGNVAMVDTSVEALPDTLSAESLRVLLSVDADKTDARESINEAWKDNTKAIDETEAKRTRVLSLQLAILIGATFVLLLRRNPRWKKSQPTDTPVREQTEPATDTLALFEVDDAVRALEVIRECTTTTMPDPLRRVSERFADYWNPKEWEYGAHDNLLGPGGFSIRAMGRIVVVYHLLPYNIFTQQGEDGRHLLSAFFFLCRLVGSHEMLLMHEDLPWEGQDLDTICKVLVAKIGPPAKDWAELSRSEYFKPRCWLRLGLDEEAELRRDGSVC